MSTTDKVIYCETSCFVSSCWFYYSYFFQKLCSQWCMRPFTKVPSLLVLSISNHYAYSPIKTRHFFLNWLWKMTETEQKNSLLFFHITPNSNRFVSYWCGFHLERFRNQLDADCYTKKGIHALGISKPSLSASPVGSTEQNGAVKNEEKTSDWWRDIMWLRETQNNYEREKGWEECRKEHSTDMYVYM